MNVNSNGSVIPVSNAVIPAANKSDPTAFFLLGAAHLYIANAAAGKPNIMNGNLPAINLVVPETIVDIVFAQLSSMTDLVGASPETIVDIVSAEAPTKSVILDN